MTHWWAIALGGGLGSVLRYAVSALTHSRISTDFPYGTLVVNVTGSFLIGLLYVLLTERETLDPVWRAGLIIGVLGGFTTFSSFSLETLNLLLGGALGKAALNILLSVGACLVATWAGVVSARNLYIG